jgi:hypothetical protein
LPGPFEQGVSFWAGRKLGSLGFQVFGKGFQSIGKGKGLLESATLHDTTSGLRVLTVGFALPIYKMSRWGLQFPSEHNSNQASDSFRPCTEAVLLWRDLDVPALAAFENATGEMSQSRHMGDQVHRDFAFGAVRRSKYRGAVAGCGLRFGHARASDEPRSKYNLRTIGSKRFETFST